MLKPNFMIPKTSYKPPAFVLQAEKTTSTPQRKIIDVAKVILSYDTFLFL